MLDKHTKSSVQLISTDKREPHLRSVRLSSLDYGLEKHEGKRKWYDEQGANFG